MVRSTGSQPRVIVKRRGSKWHAAEAEIPGGRKASRDSERGSAGRRGDDRSAGPAHDGQARVLAQ